MTSVILSREHSLRRTSLFAWPNTDNRAHNEQLCQADCQPATASLLQRLAVKFGVNYIALGSNTHRRGKGERTSDCSNEIIGPTPIAATELSGCSR